MSSEIYQICVVGGPAENPAWLGGPAALNKWGGAHGLAAAVAKLYNACMARFEGHFLTGGLPMGSVPHCEGLAADQDGAFVLALVPDMLHDMCTCALHPTGHGPHRGIPAASPTSAISLAMATFRYTRPSARQRRDAHLGMVCVDQDHCKRGLATKLIEHACGLATNEGAGRIGLHFPSVRPDMEVTSMVGLAFYGARGFVFDREEPMPQEFLHLIRKEFQPLGLRWMYRPCQRPDLAGLSGLWVRECNYEPRDVIQDSRAADGSHVFWGQAPTGDFVDVRCIKAEGSRVRGFAGKLSISPADPAQPGTFQLTWARHIDTMPESCPSGIDSSVCRVIAGSVAVPEMLVEEGDGFLEVWRRLHHWDAATDKCENGYATIMVGPATFESGSTCDSGESSGSARAGANGFVAVTGLTPAQLSSCA
eukprot:gene10243-273_t